MSTLLRIEPAAQCSSKQKGSALLVDGNITNCSVPTYGTIKNYNKGKKEEEDDKGFISSIKNWYKRVTGPDSTVMKTAFFALVTKDFWFFFGAVGFMHYRGNVLSLPPPA